ncbi:MAG TPA: hypothetical protein VFB80_17300, partial [Pirellulaceae bacterium]|nr:hypothetical protein [Pirellulaceae bacterium]
YHHGEQAARADVWRAAKIRPVEFQAVGGFADHSHSKLPLVASCSASGCHGDARAGAPPWRSAQAVWLAADPHASAYDVLWTFRGREITRRLAQPTGALTDEQHRQAIEQRCIGCHATTRDEGGFTLGVHCESCHGQADEWLKSHQLTSFSRGTHGFIDTKSLPARAGVCMPCHVGPQVSGQTTQAVDHDLIAAGHPRLNFEFRTYFESLPEHWDRQSDQRRLGPDFHFRSWLAGQQQQAAQFTRLRTHFGQTSPDDVREFALFDCASCHHALATGEATAGRPRPPHWPRGDLPEAQPLAVAGSLLAEAAIVNRNTFDDNVQTYLALQAVAADLPARPALHSTIDRLGQFLAQDCFFAAGDSRPPTQYDWPRRLDRSQLDLRIQAIRAVLQSLQNPPAGGLAPP